MKNYLILSLFFCQNLFSKIEHVKIKKENSTVFFANIAGYFEGEMNYTLICDSDGLRCSPDYVIDEFKITYGEKSFMIYGHTIPDSICSDIGLCCIQGIIFFTNITAVNEFNEKIIVNPLNLILTKNED